MGKKGILKALEREGKRMDKRKIKAVMALALVLLIGIWVYAGAKKQTWNDLQDAMTFETGYGVMSA